MSKLRMTFFNSAMTASKAQWPVLEQYYPHVFTLSNYLDALISSKPATWVTPNDSESFRHLIDSTVVASEHALDKIPKMPLSPPERSQSEIMDRVHGFIFKSVKGKPANVLALGYRMAGHRDEVSKLQPGREGISNYAVNSMVETLKTRDWALLLQRIGEGPMFHLLSSTSIFLDIGNDSYCQATGQPIHELKPLNAKHGKGVKRSHSTDMDQNQPQSKRQCTEGNKSLDKPVTGNTSSEINIMRGRILYSKPNLKRSSDELQAGLPGIHILNRIASVKRNDPNQEKQIEEDARKISKYIFPRQYGMHNVFTFQRQQSSWAFKDYSIRDEEIERMGPTKTPPRLKEVLPLIKQLIHRHNNVHYREILDGKCKSKLGNQKEKSMDSSVILELMSESSREFPTQSIFTNLSSVTGIHSSTSGSDKFKLKPRFSQFMCSHREVAEWAIKITSEVIPRAFWGSEDNWEQVMTNIKTFVSCRRFETLSLHYLLQNLNISEFDWAFSHKKAMGKKRRPESDARKGRELVEEFIYWYFDSFLIPLLKTAFYCTESAAFKNQVLYFRQNDWKILCQPLLDKLSSETFEPLSQAQREQSTKNRLLGFSHVRLLPKETGVRPIVNLGRKPPTKRADGRDVASINQILQAAFAVLAFERDRHIDLRGAAVLSHNDTYEKLRAFKHRHLTSDGKLPKLYLVKVDVRACFDTIEQGKLLEILKRIIQEDAYTIQRYARIAPSTGTTLKSYKRTAIPDDEDPHFLAVASKLAASLHRTVFSDQVVYGREEQAELLGLLEEHITSNVVKMGDRFYKQRVGIPQGSVLSTILCGFFYGDMESSSKFQFTKNMANLLMRYVDDYLFITTDIDQAKNFLTMMDKGHPEYGCFISSEKTVANFEHDALKLPVIHEKEISWCGMCINTRSLSISIDYSRYSETNLIDSLTVKRGRVSGSTLRRKALQMTGSRSHIIFVDTLLNSTFTVHLNIYENFLIAGMRIIQYIKECEPHHKGLRPDFISNILHQSILFCYFSINSSARGLLAKRNGGQVAISQRDVLWLGYHAFRHVFTRKKSRFGSVITTLDSRLRKYRYLASSPAKKFEPVIRTAIEHLKHVHY